MTDRGRRSLHGLSESTPLVGGTDTSATPPIRRIILAKEAAIFARFNSDEHAPDETGGIVMGHLRGDTLLISRLSGPGPRAVHRPDLFVRDGEYVQAVLDATVAETAGRDDYLGEWHSHPFPQGPSAQDRASLRRISRNPDYRCPRPVLLLCRRRGSSWQLEAYHWDTEILLTHRLEVSDLPTLPGPT